MRRQFDATKILECLNAHHVEYIVVGGVGATLQGSTLLTFDLDVVAARTPENVQRLESALRDLDAYYREHEDWKPTPEAVSLLGPGHHLLRTRYGSLDVLGKITGGRDYFELLPDTEEVSVNDELTVRVVTLEMLIRLKEEMGRDKDRAALPILKAVWEERRTYRPEGSTEEGTTGGE